MARGGREACEGHPHSRAQRRMASRVVCLNLCANTHGHLQLVRTTTETNKRQIIVLGMSVPMKRK
eukprot:2011251-Amphidinium_carterae.1